MAWNEFSNANNHDIYKLLTPLITFANKNNDNNNNKDQVVAPNLEGRSEPKKSKRNNVKKTKPNKRKTQTQSKKNQNKTSEEGRKEEEEEEEGITLDNFV